MLKALCWEVRLLPSRLFESVAYPLELWREGAIPLRQAVGAARTNLRGTLGDLSPVRVYWGTVEVLVTRRARLAFRRDGVAWTPDYEAPYRRVIGWAASHLNDYEDYHREMEAERAEGYYADR